MKEISKRFINIHGTYGPVGALPHNVMSSYGGQVGVLPDYSYYYYPTEQARSSTYIQEKPQEVPYYLPLVQETSEIPVLDLPITYQNPGSFPMVAYSPQSTLSTPTAIPLKEGFYTTQDNLVSLTTAAAGARVKGIGMEFGDLFSPSISPSLLGQTVLQAKGTPLISSRSRTSPSSKPRSPLLEGFRNNRCPLLNLGDIRKHALEFSKDQHGSRFIQQKLEHSTPAEINTFYQELEPCIGEVMLDVFGNYVVQKLLDFGGTEIQRKILDKVYTDLKKLTVHQYGCRVVQKTIFIFPKDVAAKIVKELESCLMEIMKDQHGNHVVQKCVEKVDSNVLQIIISHCIGKIIDVSCDPYGCRIIQRFLENANLAQRRQILAEVNPNIFDLIQDQYGNYVIQHILDHGSTEEIDRVVQSIGGHVAELAQHKYASNVLEKCVEKTQNVHRSKFITELVNSGKMDAMIEGQYSNYVLQKMMDTAPAEVIKSLMVILRLHRTSMEKHSYGKNIWARLEKYFTDHPA